MKRIYDFEEIDYVNLGMFVLVITNVALYFIAIISIWCFVWSQFILSMMITWYNFQDKKVIFKKPSARRTK